MRTRPVHTTCLVSLAFLALVSTTGAARAHPQEDTAEPAETPPGEETEPEPAECFPPCRSGFLCHQGQCISRCNPLCPDGQICTDDGQCEPSVQPAPALQPVPAPQPVYLVEPPPPPPQHDYNRRGLQLTLNAGGLFVPHYSETDFNLNADHGGQLGAWIGWRINGWVALDAGGLFAALTEEEEYQSYNWDEVRYFHNLVLLDAGVLVYPIGARFPVDLVLGFHLGYLRLNQRVTRSTDSGSEIKFRAWLQGISFSESIGVELHVAEGWTIGLIATIISPLWLQYCDEWTPSNSTFDGGCTGLSDKGTGPLQYNQDAWDRMPWFIRVSASVTAVFD